MCGTGSFGGYTLLADVIDLLIGEVPDPIVEFLVQLGLDGRHHLVQACEPAVPRSKSSDGSRHVLDDGPFVPSSELSLFVKLLEHVVQKLCLALREFRAWHWFSQLLPQFVGHVGVLLVFNIFNYNWVVQLLSFVQEVTDWTLY